jgi:hypothetical protein
MPYPQEPLGPILSWRGRWSPSNSGRQSGLHAFGPPLTLVRLESRLRSMNEASFRTWIAQGAQGRFCFTEPGTDRRWSVEYIDDREFDGHYEAREVSPVPAIESPLRFADADAVVARFAPDLSLPRCRSEPGTARPLSGTEEAS